MSGHEQLQALEIFPVSKLLCTQSCSLLSAQLWVGGSRQRPSHKTQALVSPTSQDLPLVM